MTERKKVLFFGLSYFVRKLLGLYLERRPCIAVDLDPTFEYDWGQKGNLELYTGDASSIVLWKKLPIDTVSHIVFSLNDRDVAEELCRIARETFKLDIPMIGITTISSVPEFYEKYHITPVDPLAVGVSAVNSLIEQNYAVPTNIGMGKGEIIEVSIVRRSHLINRKLRYLGSPHWRAVAIYRDNTFIMPDANDELMLGDRAVLVGEPKMLANIGKVLIQGVPQFPLQYGRYINAFAGTHTQPMEEANYFRKITQAEGIHCIGTKENILRARSNDIINSMEPVFKEPVENHRDDRVFSGAGVVVISVHDTFKVDFRVKYFLRNSTVPVLFAKGRMPYSNIVVSLNSDAPAQVLQAALEIANLSNIPLKVFYAAAPKQMRNAKLEAEFTDRQRIVRDYENIERFNLQLTVAEGNPVKELQKFLTDIKNPLVVIGNDPDRRMDIFTPHVPYLLLKRLSNSMLTIPLTGEE